jgi:hypothetical protein
LRSLRTYINLLLIVESLYSLHYLVQIDLFKLQSQLFHLVFRESLKELLLVDVYDLAKSGASHSAPSFDVKEELFIAKEAACFELTETVLDFLGCFLDLPRLITLAAE